MTFRIPRSVTASRLLTVLGLGLGVPAPAWGQVPSPPPAEARMDIRRAQAARPELEANLLQIDSILGSPGYSGRIREAKRREKVLIQQRLSEGDLQVGDALALTVLGEAGLTGTFVIGAGQILSLPGLEPIPMRGVLRSEAEAHLTQQLQRYLRDPSVRVQTSIRLSILGAVGKQGFYQIPADVMMSDAIMAAGGPAGGADPNRTVVRRAGTLLLTEEEIAAALVRGATLDQLNLRAGDEITVDTKLAGRRSTFSVVSLVSVLTTTLFLASRVMRVF